MFKFNNSKQLTINKLHRLGSHEEQPLLFSLAHLILCYDLLLEIFTFTKNFTREYKYTIGEGLKKETMELLTKIFRANARQDKVQVLQEAREHIEVVRLYVRIMRDLHQIGNKKFVNINQRIENVSRQLTGWQKKSIKAKPM